MGSVGGTKKVEFDYDLCYLIGGPGVGKGTQCKLAAEQFNFEHISVGELLRTEEQNTDSFFRDFITESIRKSVVVPATLTMQLLAWNWGRKKNAMAAAIVDRSLEWVGGRLKYTCHGTKIVLRQGSYLLKLCNIK